MSKKRKKKIQIIRAEIPSVRIPIERQLEVLESPEESRERLGEICDDCGKKRDTTKVGKEFLCKDCREELLENEH